MPKGKSSASSGTRKKHAKKAGKDEDDAETPQQSAQRGQKKLTKAQKKAPKVKQYIPPPKPPAPPIPDPLDGQGLARELPADLVVVLRRLGKKDEVTRRKGLEELKDWIARLKEGDEVEQELKETALLSAVPVWLHNLASLLQSPFHRSLALQLQSDLLAIPSIHASIVDSLSLGLLPGTQNRDVLGSWFVAALEDGRRSRVTQAWESSTSWGPAEGHINLAENRTTLIEYLSLAILDPASLHDDIHPAPVSSAPVAPRKGKYVLPDVEAEEEPEDNELLARYRVGGLIGLTRVVQASKPTPELLDLLRQPALWSLLSEGDSDQPAVRRSAYTLLDFVVDALPEEVEKSLSFLSPAVHVCWLEKDAGVWQQAGQAVAKFLNKYRHSWTVAASPDEEDDSDEDEDDDEPFPKPFVHFLGWLSTICPLIPHLTYPLLLVIVSTLPDNLQSDTSALESFFVHLWSPIDARLLSTHSMPNQLSAFQAFFQAAVDCTIFLIKKAINRQAAEWLVQEQLVRRAWEEGVLEMGGRDKKREHEAEIFGKALARVDPSLVETARLGDSLYARCFQVEDGTVSAALLPRSIGVISAVQKWAPRAGLSIGEIANRASELFTKTPSALLADVLLMAFAEGPQATTALSLSTQLPALLTVLPPTTIVRLFEATSSETSGLWSVINSPDTPRETRFALALAVIDSTLGGDLDAIALEATQSALEVDSPAGTRVACASLDVVSEDALHTILALVCTSIHDQVDDIINGAEAAVPLSAMNILAAYASKHPEALAHSDILLQALVAVHHLVFLLPRDSLETFQAPAVAQNIWNTGMSGDGQDLIAFKVFAALREMLGRVSCLVEPAVLVDVALSNMDLVQDLTTAIPSAPHPTLSIVDDLVPCTGEVAEDRTSYDSRGMSRNARYAEAALAVLRADRKLATQRIHLLVMVLTAATAARDTLNVPNSGRGFFSPSTERLLLEDYIREADGTLSFALATLDDAPIAWHQAAIGALSGKNSAEDPLQELLVALAQRDGDIASRVLRDVLGRYLRHSGIKELELWLALGMSTKSSLSLAIISAVKPHMLDSEKLQTAQNRLASGLTASPTPDVPALRRLLASAPPADSPSVFLPQQRAIFVLRHVGSWLTSDEDYDESLEVYVAQLYAALAPIVQDVGGGHWDAIFDLIESGLETASMEDDSSHCLLFACLVLLQQVRDLAASNKSLRTLWVAKDKHLGLVLKLFLQCRQSDTVPLQLIHAAILNLLQDVSNIEGAGIDDLCELLHSSSSAPVQCTAYSILAKVIKSKTVDLVLADTATPLPSKLIEILSTPADWDEIEMHTALARLLGWMAVLDHFEDASRTLRWAYLDQINSTQLLETSLIPMLFGILGVTEVGAWNFPSSQYGVDEFYPDLLDPGDLPDLAPLASHIFYRALTTLPSAMRTFYENLKDRQLSMSMLNFTARHYSPAIIRHEFSALRQPAALALFTEEGLNVRIAQGGGATVAAGAGSAEAIASYVVDEQPMEIGIRLPAEFPLRGVEIRDLKRVGVPENKWRGWLMSVQQTITSRNGLILEALTVFKKNVSLHFEGVVECAICYSIISLTDRTLPTKPCRTCKNRFHASCLFKWFNSSHSSSCPMCRALF